MASIDLKDSFLHLYILLIKNIKNLRLMTCFNLHAWHMDKDLLESLIKYLKYHLDIWGAWVTTLSCM